MSMPINGPRTRLPCGDTFCQPEFEDHQALFCPHRKFGCKKMSKSPDFPFHGDGLYNHRRDQDSTTAIGREVDVRFIDPGYPQRIINC